MAEQVTPRPWLIGHALANGQVAVIGDGDTVVCLLPDESSGCTLNQHDARLIAAAPELLEALEIARDYAAYVSGEAADLALMDAAIAKATGEGL